MKKSLLLFALLGVTISIGQILPFPLNQSDGNVLTTINFPTPQQPDEIFRFRPGSVRQLDLGTSFNFSNSRWFSLGRVDTGSQTVYGLRFQLPNKSLTLGYQDINSINPRLQWIGNGSNLGNLEFRVANSFFSTNSTLVARMTAQGNTVFGTPLISTSNPAKVSIQNSGSNGLLVTSSGATGSLVSSSVGLSISQFTGTNSSSGAEIATSGNNNAFGLTMKTSGKIQSLGIQSFASGSNSATNTIGVLGGAFTSNGSFNSGIYGETNSNSFNSYAGFFDGNVFTTGSYLPSDKKLKSNIRKESDALERLSLLNPVTYTYKDISELNLSKGEQHGFISQEFAEVFPELTRDITKPVFDKEGNITSSYSLKAINYNGLISVLTAAITELNEELISLKDEIAYLKENQNQGTDENTPESEIILEQNVPNPFSENTSIKYQLNEDFEKASIMVFDMNGTFLKEYQLSEPRGNVQISSSDIGRGMFIYSLVSNGQELTSKKMIVK